MNLDTHRRLARRDARVYLAAAIEACEDAGFTPVEIAPLVAMMEKIMHRDRRTAPPSAKPSSVTHFATSA